ncbi:MAG: trypsin-like peptidase domain-containing protein [Nitrospirae bacterium]|nr:trypsin-like peptidase domain-containing protein [Candidatus Manganitrophaceae bacterium]
MWRCLFLMFLSLSSFLAFSVYAEESPRNYTFAELVKTERAAIVSIRSSRFAKEGGGPLKDFFSLPGNRLKPEVREGSLGTGFLIDSSGLILTNYHVIAPSNHLAEGILIRTADQREFPVRIIGKDPKIDVALLQIEGNAPFFSVTLGNSDQMEIGEWVVALGNPFGIEEMVTVGVVSGVGRALGTGPYDSFIQTDAAINIGNSGGPLFNIRGEVIGINTALNASTQGIGFAIPINMVRKILPALQSEGAVTRGWLGVMIQQLTTDLAKAFRLKDDQGALVSEVMKQSPAEQAGVLRGDVITEYDGKKVSQMHDLPTLVAETPVGKTVAMRVIRDGAAFQLRVKIQQLKDE